MGFRLMLLCVLGTVQYLRESEILQFFSEFFSDQHHSADAFVQPSSDQCTSTWCTVLAAKVAPCWSSLDFSWRATLSTLSRLSPWACSEARSFALPSGTQTLVQWSSGQNPAHRSVK